MATTFSWILSTAGLLLAGCHFVIMPSWGALLTVQTAPLEQTSDQFLKKWLDQDVVYIIAADEKAAFKRLTTDEERYQFIEQFWLRRDPSPNTTKNETRDEHYRRIAYANERFSAAEPGWRTDRGRIYITLGPPDQIEAHPLGEGRSGPFEIWRYQAGTGTNPTPEWILKFAGTDYKLQGR
jgi:GWxTD domain-containing protein